MHEYPTLLDSSRPYAAEPKKMATHLNRDHNAGLRPCILLDRRNTTVGRFQSSESVYSCYMQESHVHTLFCWCCKYIRQLSLPRRSTLKNRSRWRFPRRNSCNYCSCGFNILRSIPCLHNFCPPTHFRMFSKIACRSSIGLIEISINLTCLFTSRFARFGNTLKNVHTPTANTLDRRRRLEKRVNRCSPILLESF